MNKYDRIIEKSNKLFEEAFAIEELAWEYNNKATTGQMKLRMDNLELDNDIEYRIIIEDQNYEAFERLYNLYYYVYKHENLNSFQISEIEVEIRNALNDNSEFFTMCYQNHIYINRVDTLEELNELENYILMGDGIE
jgi:trans-2-enoyl-CoA reductase